MCSKSLKSNPGFMLTEVLIAMAIISLAITPALSQLNVLRFLYTDSRLLRVVFTNKNILTEQTFKAQDSKQQKASFSKADKKTGVDSKYTRSPIKKGVVPFKNFDESQIRNLCKQEVETTYKKVKDRMFNFLYKPLISDS